MIEHKSILNTCAYIETVGCDVSYVKPEISGIVSFKKIKEAVKEETGIISLMHVNNETGVINDIEEIVKLCENENIIFHSDMAQSIGKIPVDLLDLGVQSSTLSAHKIYGPKGVGALYFRGDCGKLDPLSYGGGQEGNLRSGTVAVPLIVGLTKALALSIEDMNKEDVYYRELRKIFLNELNKEKIKYILNNNQDFCLPRVLNISFLGVPSETLMMRLWGKVCLSNGSACSAGKIESSYVLSAMGVSKERLESAIRLSFGRNTSEKDVVVAAQTIADEVRVFLSC